MMEFVIKTKRIDITLPAQRIDQIDLVWREFGFASRSAFLDEAAKRLAVRLQKADFKRKLKAGYLNRAKNDTEINRELEILTLDPA